MHIFDSEAFAILSRLEGAAWAATQAARPQSPFGFFSWHAAWEAKCEMLKAHPEYADEPVASFQDVSGDGAIYGAGGWARYVVRPDGEIVLLQWSVSPEKQVLAAAAGVRVG